MTDVRAAAIAQFHRVDDAVAALPGEAFARPTRLPGWTVAELVTHLARNVESVYHRLDEPAPGPVDTDLTAYLLAMRGVADKVAQRAVDNARDATPEGLRRRLAEAVAAAEKALDGVDDLGMPVRKVLGTIPLHDFLVTRCVEGVVHGLDLAAAVPDSGAAVPDPAALKIVVRTFADLLKHVAPGRSVEVRIPGHVAVQCVEGPPHTRGTPGNVVEADAVPFVEACAGRLTWTDAVRGGGIRASGERADLSGYLPLIG